MSSRRQERVTCPNCGKISNFTIWDRLNTRLNPIAKLQLFNGSLFRLKCSCGYISAVDYTMLYHDQRNKVMLHYFSNKTTEEADKEFAELIRSGAFELLSGYRHRIVSSQQELREKALIFNEGLDDRVIEYLKTAVYAQVIDTYPKAKRDQFFLIISNSTWTIHFQIDGTPYQVEVYRSDYDHIYDQMKHFLTLESAPLRVDSLWAMNFHRRYMNH